MLPSLPSRGMDPFHLHQDTRSIHFSFTIRKNILMGGMDSVALIIYVCVTNIYIYICIINFSIPLSLSRFLSLSLCFYVLAIRGRCKAIQVFGDLTVTNIHVYDVFKQSKVKITPNAEYTLWTNSSCLCPRIELGKLFT